MQKYPGVIHASTRDGDRYRVAVSIAGFRPVLGGTHRNLDDAIEIADSIRFWAHRLGITLREPRLIRPQRFSDAENLPECHPTLREFAATKESREKADGSEKPTSFGQLVLQIQSLQARVAALEAAANKPKHIDLKNT